MAGYKTLFKLRILHSYYNKGYGSDFSIIPLPQTEKLAKQHKLLFREVENGLDVLSLMVDEHTPKFDLGDANKLSFCLMLKNTHLINFTELPEKTKSKQFYQLQNDEAFGTTLTPDTWKLVEPSPIAFTYSWVSQADKVMVRITDPFGRSFLAGTVQIGTRYTRPLDLGNRMEGRYSLGLIEDDVDQETNHLYLSEGLWRKRPFVIADIFSSQLDYQQIKEYSISLSSKRSTWTYLINLSKDYTGSTISIEDARESPEVFFKQTGPNSQKAGDTLRFTTYKINQPDEEAEIAFQESPIADFNLIIEKNGTKTEIRGLPNPAIDQVKTEMHINI